jgi:putative endonuclease
MFGAPEETVGARKQRRVIAAARDWLARRRGPERAARFDVIAVVDGPQGPTLTHYENAFEAG